VFVSHAWTDLVALCERAHGALADPQSQGAMLVLMDIFRACHRFPHHFAELVEGAGTIDDLARLVVRYTAIAARNFDIFKPTRRDRPDPTLCGVLLFFTGLSPSFLRCLASAGLVKLLTETVMKLAGAGFTLAATGRCLLPLVDLIDCVGAPSLITALKAGLLRALILRRRDASESDSDAEHVSHALEHLVRATLIDATFSYSCMIALKSALPEALAIQHAAGFMHSPLWEDWSLFTAVAVERLQYVEEFRTTYLSTRECSNYDVSLSCLVIQFAP
jgi:hypothetical protein